MRILLRLVDRPATGAICLLIRAGGVRPYSDPSEPSDSCRIRRNAVMRRKEPPASTTNAAPKFHPVRYPKALLRSKP
jgi:hypothetical protein